MKHHLNDTLSAAFAVIVVVAAALLMVSAYSS